MGCVSRINCQNNETPAHKVCLDSFWIGKTEVTQAQWKQIMRSNPSIFKEDFRPVEQVSWNDAQKFLQKLNTLAGKEIYRLPFEAEWEYAARAGTETPYSFGSDFGELENYAWYNENSAEETHPVAQLKPNAWGLYDMHGNVWEWCQDWYKSTYYSKSPTNNPQGPSSGHFRMLRGGTLLHDSTASRSAFRFRNTPDIKHYDGGFRVVAGSVAPTQ